MTQTLTSLHRIRPARGRGGSVRVAAPILATLLLTACATCPPGPTRTEISRVPTPVWQPIPERYIRPLSLPTLQAPLNHGQLESDTSLLESLIERYEADRAELRRIQRRRAEP
ncbi:MAG: hypothetical protein ACOC0Q_01400 [Wenzhouxiangella sp.]